MAFAPVLALTFLMSSALSRVMRVLALQRDWLDVPNDRSSHVQPTPRLGGVAIAASAIGAWAIGLALGLTDGRSAWIWTSAAAGAVGLVDDLRGLRPSAKMAGQAIVAGAAVYFGRSELLVNPSWACFAVFTIVAFANVFNFMDGSDGLAAGMAVLFAAGVGVLGASAGGGRPVFVACVTAASAAGFLMLNWSRASIFMGDSGSLFLGFVLAALSWQVASAGVPLIATGLIFLPFAGDACWTLFRRARAGERLWEAHRSHMYQRLLIQGRSHQAVALIYYAWGVLAVGMATTYASGTLPVRGVVLLAALGSVAAMELFVGADEAKRAGGRPSSVATPIASSGSLGV